MLQFPKKLINNDETIYYYVHTSDIKDFGKIIKTRKTEILRHTKRNERATWMEILN